MTPQFVAYLTILIYDCKTFIVQATDCRCALPLHKLAPILKSIVDCEHCWVFGEMSSRQNVVAPFFFYFRDADKNFDHIFFWLQKKDFETV